MTMPTHAQTAAGLDATARAMQTTPSLDADQAARLVTLGHADAWMSGEDTDASLLYEAITDEIAYQHAPGLDADQADTAREIPRDEALRCARAGAARFHSYS